jgi:hypothetical protein
MDMQAYYLSDKITRWHSSSSSPTRLQLTIGTWGPFWTSTLAPRDEICPLGEMFTPSFTPRGKHSLLLRRIENVNPQGINSPPGDKIHPWGTTSPLGSKFAPRGEIKNEPHAVPIRRAPFPSSSMWSFDLPSERKNLLKLLFFAILLVLDSDFSFHRVKVAINKIDVTSFHRIKLTLWISLTS